MADETILSARPAVELRKLELEVEKLKLDITSSARIQRFDLVLRLMPALTIMVTVLGFVFTVWQYSHEQARARAAAERQSVRDAEARQREFMKPLLEKQQQLYFEAAAATITSSSNPSQRQQAEAKFWILYWGPLVMVESTDVSGAMKAFGMCLSGNKKCSDGEVQNRSLALASTLETSILRTWNAKPEEFTKEQFVYR
jgi:hypothetical protein